MLEYNNTIITGNNACWAFLDQPGGGPHHMLNDHEAGGKQDQTWFHLGGASYLIQAFEERSDEIEALDIVIQVTGVVAAQANAANILLLG